MAVKYQKYIVAMIRNGQRSLQYNGLQIVYLNLETFTSVRRALKAQSFEHINIFVFIPFLAVIYSFYVILQSIASQID